MAEFVELRSAPASSSLRIFGLPAHDAAGPYLTGYSRLFTFYSLRTLPPKFVYHELVRAARWLRQNADLASGGASANRVDAQPLSCGPLSSQLIFHSTTASDSPTHRSASPLHPLVVRHALAAD